MGIIKGQNLRVMIGGKCIALATSCTFHIATQMEDSSTKDSEGDWAENEVVGLSWDASTDSLVTVDTDSTGTLVTDLFTAMISKTKVQLVFDVTNGTKNRTATNSTIKKSGMAFISDLSISAPNRQNSVLTAQFSGSGALS